jgi:hypothetical protein
MWYAALVQVRVATWFKALVVLPSSALDSEGGISFTTRCIRLTRIMDHLQGSLGPLVGLFLWVLLYAGILTRGWLYVIGHALTALCGFRALLAIVRQRVMALRKVAALQNVVRGTADDKKRRKGILRNKAFTLLVDLMGVFAISLLFPTSLLVLGSPFSSRQMVANCAVLAPVIILLPCTMAADMYMGVVHAARRLEDLQKLGTRDSSLSQMSAFSTSGWLPITRKHSMADFAQHLSGIVASKGRKSWTQRSSVVGSRTHAGGGVAVGAV